MMDNILSGLLFFSMLYSIYYFASMFLRIGSATKTEYIMKEPVRQLPVDDINDLRQKGDRMDVINWNEKGEYYESVGMNEEALRCYELAIENDTKHPPSTCANENRARLLGRMGRWEEAVRCEVESVNLMDKVTDMEMIEECIENEGKEAAMQKISMMLEADKNNFPLLYTMGHLLNESGRLDEAMKYYQTAAEIDPRNESVINDMGMILMKQDRYREALDCFCRALEIDPINSIAWNNKGTMLEELGGSEEALKCYSKALNIDQEYAQAWHNKGDLLSGMGRIEEALLCYRRELEAGGGG